MIGKNENEKDAYFCGDFFIWNDNADIESDDVYGVLWIKWW